MNEKTKTLEEIRLFVSLVLICGFYTMVKAHNFSENQTNNDLKSVEFESIFFSKNLDSADIVVPEFVYEDNDDRRHIEVQPNATEQTVPEGGVFISIEQMPQFPGGEAELMKFLSDNLVYPEVAKKNGIQGRVVIHVEVFEDGSIGEVKVGRGKSPELDKAAVEVVKKLPKFVTPGLVNGKPTKMWIHLPINFRLPQE